MLAESAVQKVGLSFKGLHEDNAHKVNLVTPTGAIRAAALRVLENDLSELGT